MVKEYEKDFNEEFDVDELAKEYKKDFGEEFDVDELAKEYEKDFNEEFDVDELAKEYEKDFNEEFDVDELAKEYEKDFNEEFEVDELAKEYEKDFEDLQEYENVDSQSTVQVHETPEMQEESQEDPYEENEECNEYDEDHLENDEEIELDPDEYEQNQDPIHNPDEIDFIRDVEELARIMREYTEVSGESEEDIKECDNAGFKAEQAYNESREIEQNQEQKEVNQEVEEKERELTKEENTEQTVEDLSIQDQQEDFEEIEEEFTEIEQEEFEYFWEKYAEYEQEGRNDEEIAELMHEAEEAYEVLKQAEEAYSQQEKENLKSINQEEEEDLEEYKKEIETKKELEYFVEAEEKLYAEGKSSEEVAKEMQKVENVYEIKEEVEKIYEQQEKDKLKLVDHEDDEDLEDERDEIDRRDAIEFFIETEEELHQREKSQEEIDEQMEKIANDYFQNEQEKNPQIEQEKEIIKEIKNVPKEIDEKNSEIEEQKKVEQALTQYDERDIEVNLEAEEVIEDFESNLEDNVTSDSPQERIDESLKELEGEDLEEDEYKKLQELYHQETGRNPMYAKKETKGFRQWLEEQDLKTKEVEEKEGEDEGWKKTFKKWIEETREAEINIELKQILADILQNFSKYEEFEELLRKYKIAKLTEKEREKLNIIVNKFLNKYSIHLQLYYNLSGFKAYFLKQHWWNPWLVTEIKNKFLNHLSKKYEILKLNSRFSREEIKFFKNHGFDWRLLNTRSEWVKLTEQEKVLIRKEFLAGIPIQRIIEIINNYKENFKDDFIDILQSHYNEMITKNIQKLSLGVKRIDKIINGFENMIYLDRSLSKDSIKKIELLINREIQVIKNWRKPRKGRISGVRIQISDEGIKTIKDELKSGIPIQRISGIINDYDIKDNFIRYIKQMIEIALKSHEKKIRIPLTKMGKFIRNWQNILYRGYVISESDFNKLKLLIGKENPISHKIVYGRRNLEVVKLVKNEAHAELIGAFIVRGSIRTDRNDLYISYNSDDHPDYISHLGKLITKVFGRPPSMMGTRDRFYISGPDVILYLASQGLSNKNRNVPSWIKKSLSWVQENSDEWKAKYLSLVIACLKGMINGSGSIVIPSKQDRIDIYLSKSNRSILRDFKEMCNSLGIRTSNIKKQIRDDGRIVYYIYIISRNQVKQFLIDIVKPKKWDCIKDNIQKILNARGTSIELVLEMTPEFKDLRRRLFQHQKQQYTFRYYPTRIMKIKNNILRDCYNNYIKNISLDLFPSYEFEVKTNIRPSKLKFRGEHIKDMRGRTLYREDIKTQFIKEHLVKNNPNIVIYYYNDLQDGVYKNILNIVRQVYVNFRNKSLGRPWHEPILKKIMINHPNALASEVPVWKKLINGEYYVGHIDLNLVAHNTFFIADLKDDETDIIKSLIQVMSYGINQKRLIFKNDPDYNAIDFKCILFTKDELWIFDPETLKHNIIKFIEYANSVRMRNLKSLPYSKGLKRTDLLEDIEKVVGFLQRCIEEEEDNDLDVDNS